MKFAEKTIEDFLYTPNKSFTIPEFQRPYSWQINNVKEYLNDLEEAVSNDKGHYFGTVVFVLDNIDSSSIIDGQQRVTTSLLMIVAIYHLLKQNSALSDDPKITADVIRDNYLVNRDDSNRIKLRTVTTDNAILQKIFDVDGEESKLTQNEKQSKLYQAYAEFKNYFSNKDNLSKYISGLGRFEIVTIALDPRDDNPQRVFESINSTGKPLTDGDKIRNFALMLNNDTIRNQVYNRYWSKIEQSLTDVNKDYITDFFRSYIISKRQAIVKMDNVYPEFKKLFYKQISPEQNLEEIDKFYSDIVKKLNCYLLLKLGKDENIESNVVKGVAFKMRYIQTDLYIPFALSVMGYHEEGKITQEQLEEVFRLIEIYFSRRIVCNINTTSVDRFLASLHKDVIEYLKTDSDADYVEVMKYLFLSRTGQTHMPSDVDYIAAIRTNPTYAQRKSHINYILASVDDLSKESNTLRQIADGSLKLSIEHIMPQTLTREWEEELGANEYGVEHAHLIHDQYLHTLSNLTLTGYNSEYSNRDFIDKKALVVKGEKVGFNDSPLKINQWIARRDKWNENSLKDRQDWWIENLTKVWPLPQTSFKPVEPDTTVFLLDEQDLKGKGVRSVQVFGDTTLVGTWSEALDVIAETLFDKHPNFYEAISEDEYLSKHIKTDDSGFYHSVEILDSGLYIDTGNDTNTKLRIIKSLGRIFNLTMDDIKAELTKSAVNDLEA